MSHEDELSGYDVRKVTEWSIRYFYWSPSFSQIYSELRKLEKIGLVTSRVDHDNGARSRRLYKITAAGLEAVTRWANDTPAEPPMLKHSVLLRVAFGHLADAVKLKELLQEHVEFAEHRPRTMRTAPKPWTRGPTRGWRCSGRRGTTPTSANSPNR